MIFNAKLLAVENIKIAKNIALCSLQLDICVGYA